MWFIAIAAALAWVLTGQKPPASAQSTPGAKPTPTDIPDPTRPATPEENAGTSEIEKAVAAGLAGAAIGGTIAKELGANDYTQVVSAVGGGAAGVGLATVGAIVAAPIAAATIGIAGAVEGISSAVINANARAALFESRRVAPDKLAWDWKNVQAWIDFMHEPHGFLVGDTMHSLYGANEGRYLWVAMPDEKSALFWCQDRVLRVFDFTKGSTPIATYPMGLIGSVKYNELVNKYNLKAIDVDFGLDLYPGGETAAIQAAMDAELAAIAKLTQTTIEQAVSLALAATQPAPTVTLSPTTSTSPTLASSTTVKPSYPVF